MKLSCIIVEDEPMALQKLEGFVGEVDFLDLKAGFDNSLDALNFLNSNSIDLMFLDIQMDKLNGIQLLETLQQKPRVIITTAYSQYAIKGYELMVSDYLLKPFSFERFLQAVNKVAQEKEPQTDVTIKHREAKSIFVKTAYQIEHLTFDEILFFEGMGDYIAIVSKNKKILCLQTFKSILQVLPASDFIRVHKSYVVSFDKIESISHDRIKIGEKLIPVSQTYREEFYASLKKYRELL